MRTLVAIPVYNEVEHVRDVLARVREHVSEIVVIDDGSTDGTAAVLDELPVDVIRHCTNRGYGRAISDAFSWAQREGFDWVITMDCDEQHEPGLIPEFIAAAREEGRNGVDIISGSRYLRDFAGDGPAPSDRRAINAALTREINTRLAARLGTITDSFCGFKAHRVSSLRKLTLTETGYAFPMQFWAQAAAAGMSVRELAVPRIYNDNHRGFGGTLDDAAVRLAHYRHVLHREIARQADRLPREARVELDALGHAPVVVRVPPRRASDGVVRTGRAAEGRRAGSVSNAVHPGEHDPRACEYLGE